MKRPNGSRRRGWQATVCALSLGWALTGCGTTAAPPMAAAPKPTATPPVVAPKPAPMAAAPKPAPTAAPTAADDRSHIVSDKIEQARNAYLTALDAEAQGDSTGSVDGFQTAIDLLTELGSYPGIEQNDQFSALLRSVISDYETYITEVDRLDPSTSAYALRRRFLQESDTDLAALRPPPVTIPHTTIALDWNIYVERNVTLFQTRARGVVTGWLARKPAYWPMFERIMVKEYGLPPELLHLAMIESGLKPTAQSWASAVGMWQFIRATGNMVDLHGNWWYDERRDPEKATRGAAKHLKELYQATGDWHLALAAYNCGLGGVRRAQRMNGGKGNFWEIRRYLPRETQNYVPIYIAASLMTMYPAEFGVTMPEQVQPELVYDVVPISESVDLAVIAQCAGTDLATIRALNPDILQWCTPPGVRNYPVKIPVGQADQFARAYASVATSARRAFVTHRVGRGETLAQVARRYGVTPAVLAQVNRLSVRSRLRRGQQLTVPQSSQPALDAIAAPDVAAADDSTTLSLAVAESIDDTSTAGPLATVGESTARAPMIAVRSVTDVPPMVVVDSRGEALTSDASSSNGVRRRVIYRVKRGDTIGEIAQAHRVSVTELKKWNRLRSSRVQRGQRLTVYVGGGTPNVASTTSGGAWRQHRVRRGETLTAIARQHGQTVANLRAWNGLTSARLRAGQTLRIRQASNRSTRRPSTTRTRRSASAATARSKQRHNVRSGDTLWSIAQHYDVSVDDLKRWNGLSDRAHLQAGRKLTIYTN